MLLQGAELANEQQVFLEQLQRVVSGLTEAVASESGDWVIKGFIDVYQRVYALTSDTKVVSKVLELALYPKMAEFADANGYELILSVEQNHYPDLSFVGDDGAKYAVDMKTTYRTNGGRVNGMTLGAFTGYFRDRTSRKNTTFPYGEYAGHYVLGVIYTKMQDIPPVPTICDLSGLASIKSVIKEFGFFAQPKYRIASSRPGSGNTKNIGSVTLSEQLVEGTGPFAELGEQVFDDYWMYYLTRDMARAADLPSPPYTDLVSYARYRCKCPDLNEELAARVQAIDTGSAESPEDGE